MKCSCKHHALHLDDFKSKRHTHILYVYIQETGKYSSQHPATTLYSLSPGVISSPQHVYGYICAMSVYALEEI